jgi:hypothetical protein
LSDLRTGFGEGSFVRVAPVLDLSPNPRSRSRFS